MKITALPVIALVAGMQLPAARALTPPLEALMEAECSFMLKAEDTESTVVAVPTLSVLSPPASQPKLVVELEPGAQLEAVICWRSRVELGPKDDWVASTGVPLYIRSTAEGADPQILVLELTPVGYRARVTSGPAPSKESGDQIEALIGLFNSRLPGGA